MGAIMELNKLYYIAEKENIDIIDFKMKNKAIIGCIGNNYTIGLNYSIIDNSNEEKTILAEELGHYYTNTLYNYNYSSQEIRKIVITDEIAGIVYRDKIEIVNL